MRTVAALCVSGRSIYNHLPGVVAYDSRRDARTFSGGMPVVAHPPCRLWSRNLSHQAKAENPEAEKNLGRWYVEQVLRCGGVLEHPAHSKLFEDCNLPLPNCRTGDPFLFTLYVEQCWFGYATPKPTWVLVSGVPLHQVEAMPFSLGACRHDAMSGLSQSARARSVQPFAQWLCQTARSSWWSLPRANPASAKESNALL